MAVAMQPAKLLYTPAEAAAALGLSRTTIYELLGTGELRSISVGRARRIPAEALGEFVAAREQEAGRGR